MQDLIDNNFETLNKDSKALSQDEIQDYLTQLDGWSVQKEKKVDQLVKIYSFKNFMDALEFTNKVGALAEQYNHHPALKTEWGRVEVRWWTHLVDGLHLNDFIMATKTDRI
jgi:4a-hydroxytetrahydrobiopterin dehydratase